MKSTKHVEQAKYPRAQGGGANGLGGGGLGGGGGGGGGLSGLGGGIGGRLGGGGLGGSLACSMRMISIALTSKSAPRSNFNQGLSELRVWHTVFASSVHASMIWSEFSTSMTSVRDPDCVVEAIPVSAESKPPSKKMRLGRSATTVPAEMTFENGGAGDGGGLGGLSTLIASMNVVG